MTDKDKMPPKATQMPATPAKDKEPMRGGYGDHTSHDDRGAAGRAEPPKAAYPDATGMPARNADHPRTTGSPSGGLVGMAFATFDKDGKISHTGTVESWTPPDRYIVRYTGADDKPGVSKMIEGKQLTSPDINETRPNTVELFESESALKAWLESDEAKAITKPAPQ